MGESLTEDGERDRARLALHEREHLALVAALAERDEVIRQAGLPPLPHWRTWVGERAEAWDRARKASWHRTGRRQLAPRDREECDGGHSTEH
jgi:hypothetical protein